MNDEEVRRTMYEGTSRFTSGGCGFSNTGDTHNEPFRASVWPVPDSLYVVVTHDRNHNSPAQCTSQGLPGGQLSKKDSKKEQAKVQVEVWTGFWTEVRIER